MVKKGIENDRITIDGSGTGTFTSTPDLLTPGTGYFLRAYATNKAGTAYGNSVTFTTKSETTNTGFAKGADIGWLQQMEATGYKFYNDAGVQTDCIQILKDHGINSIRLRTWVNPSNDKASGHCGKEETKDLQECGWCGKDLQGHIAPAQPEKAKVVEKVKPVPAPAASKKTVKPSTMPAKKAK